MHFLPDAERFRRVLGATLVLGALTLQAWWPWKPLEDAAGDVLGPSARLLGAAASLLGEAVLDPRLPAPAPVPQETGLAEMERREGTPAPLPGGFWLEVPTLSHARGSGRLVLAAGSEQGLETGQAVVFGDRWIGRIGQVVSRRAAVILWTSPDTRTGALLAPGSGEVRAICVGQGENQPPLVNWPEPGKELHSGMEVRFRAGPEDAAALGDLGLKLGILRSQGDPLRGASAWVVDEDLPAGAEGRVFVAAGAPGAPRVLDPPVVRVPFHWSLPGDAVLGDQVVAGVLEAPRPAAVLVQAGRVVGPVVASRGRLVWGLRRAPADWASQALSLFPESPLFTRGGGGIPRGLWLGAGGTGVPPLLDGRLEALAAPAGEPLP